MQTIQQGTTTHSALRILFALAIATLIGVGCKEHEHEKTVPPAPAATEAPAAAEAPAATEAPKAGEPATWEPETVKPPAAQDDHGHDHGPGGHQH